MCAFLFLSFSSDAKKGVGWVPRAHSASRRAGHRDSCPALSTATRHIQKWCLVPGLPIVRRIPCWEMTREVLGHPQPDRYLNPVEFTQFFQEECPLPTSCVCWLGFPQSQERLKEQEDAERCLRLGARASVLSSIASHFPSFVCVLGQGVWECPLQTPPWSAGSCLQASRRVTELRMPQLKSETRSPGQTFSPFLVVRGSQLLSVVTVSVAHLVI